MFFIAGCAGLTGADGALEGQSPAVWQGRMVLRMLDASPGQTPESLSARFTLRGDAQTGTLLLETPIGLALARLDWDATGARLQRGSDVQQSTSLMAMTQESFGLALPVADLFALLRGDTPAVPDWEVDRSDWAQHRLRLTHTTPPRAEVRLVLEP